MAGCISFDSYIKPQLLNTINLNDESCISFDSYIKPQLGNDKPQPHFSCISFDSYIKPQHLIKTIPDIYVVYLLIPTSNHNMMAEYNGIIKLYIFWFLHQTTTYYASTLISRGCISFDSYIKPQLFLFYVCKGTSCISFDSYIKPQPSLTSCSTSFSCISFDSYIKPQPTGYR